jgi:hypothetical protein
MRDIYKNTYLYFDEGPHRYTDTNGNEYISTTTIIGNYVPKFDADFWAHKKAIEQGVSEREIKRQWERIKNEACSRGNFKHNMFEDAIKEVSKFKNAIKYLEQAGGRCITIADLPELIPTPLDIEEFKAATDYKYDKIYDVFKFYTDRGYIIYSEIGVFDPELLISGTIDLFCDRADCFVILDWKTNRDGIKFESGYYKKDKTVVPNQLTNEWVKKSEKMLPPLNHLDECNGSHYAMQLSIYARLSERILNKPCAGLGLCHVASPFILNDYGQPYRDKDGYHVDPNGEDTVNWYRMPYLRNEADAVFRDRYLQLQSEKVKVDTQLTLDL